MNFSDNTRPKIEKESALEAHAELFSAFAYSDRLTLRLLLPEYLHAQAVNIELWHDDSMSRVLYPTDKREACDGFDVFEYIFLPREHCNGSDNGLFYYHFSFECDGRRLFVSRNGSDLLPEITDDASAVSSYQLSICADSFHTPDGLKGKIMYQIFVDRFCRGDKIVPVRSDAVIIDDWYNGVPEYPEYPGGFVRNNCFFGGTLWGVCEKLEYLKSLGVEIVYLCPIFEAYSNHKYDTGNYMRVDPMFGGDEAFDVLVSKADALGMKIILDGVFNHTGSDSLYFNKNGRYPVCGAYNSKESEYYSWYYFTEHPDKYESWWGIEILPKVNGKNPGFRELICGENGVIRHYLRRGAYGWRLDVADELEEDFLAEIRRAAKSEKDAPIIGEVWEDASNKVAYDRRRHYFRGYELDSVMNYPLKNAVIEFIMNGDANTLARISTELYAHYPKEVSDTLMNFLGTHDTSRILSLLAGDDISAKTNAELAVYRMPEEKRAIAITRLRLAYAIIATMPGVPCIFYGDEAGVEGGRDPFNRMPYPWGRENTELLDWYKKIGEIRNGEPIFRDGYFRIIEHTDRFIAYERFNCESRIAVAVNLSDKEHILDIKGVSLLSGARKAVFSVEPMGVEIVKS
ncbi:MAG: glycoside hydrolase family 13 protein [Clostridia bacterium]|nr:glycoside hydrolase family 13 protein [Clostridia bacterium]